MMKAPPLATDNKKINYITPFGLEKLQAEYHQLRFKERPTLVETVRWAASNGDRSENGDYIYGKKRLREIDKRVRYLTKQIETAKVIDPELQKSLTQVFFGATVTYQQEDNTQTTVKIVGIDEANLNEGKISFTSPMAKALMKASVGDKVRLKLPSGVAIFCVLKIVY